MKDMTIIRGLNVCGKIGFTVQFSLLSHLNSNILFVILNNFTNNWELQIMVIILRNTQVYNFSYLSTNILWPLIRTASVRQF